MLILCTENFTTAMVAKSLISSKSVFKHSYWLPGPSWGIQKCNFIFWDVVENFWIPQGVAHGGTQWADTGEFEIVVNYSFEF